MAGGGPCLAETPGEIAAGFQARILRELPPPALPVSALLEGETEAVVGLGEAWVPLEGGPLQPNRVIGAPRVKIDEAEVAPDLGIVRIECRRGFQLRHGFGRAAAAVEAEPVPRAFRGLRALDRGRSGLGHLTLRAGHLPRAGRPR